MKNNYTIFDLIEQAYRAAYEVENNKIYQYLTKLLDQPNNYDINSLYKNYLTLLNIAASTNNCELIDWLLAHGANINQRMNSWSQGNATPLLNALAKNSVEAAKLLIERGADINLTTRKDSALSLAVKNDNIELVKLLIKENANLTHINHKKSSVLHYAVEKGNIEIIRLLLLANKDSELLNKRNDNGYNIIDIAIKNSVLRNTENELKIVKILLASGQDFSLTQKDLLLKFAARRDNRFLAAYAIFSKPSILVDGSYPNNQLIIEFIDLSNLKSNFIEQKHARIGALEESNPKLKGFYDKLVSELYQQDLPNVVNLSECKDYVFAILKAAEQLAYQYKPSFLAGVSKDFYQMFRQKLSAEADNDNKVDSASKRARIGSKAQLNLTFQLTQETFLEEKSIDDFVTAIVEMILYKKDTAITAKRITNTNRNDGLAR